MSYMPYKNEDSISELFSSTADFLMVSENLLNNANNKESFIIWLDKCMKIDRRLTVKFIRDNFDFFNDAIKALVSKYVVKENINEYFD